LLVTAVVLSLSSCEWDGNFTVLGYTTKPNYDDNIKSVYVPIFANITFRRGLEFDLTQAVIREIQLKTPFKVVSNRECADTELTGKIINLNKLMLNRNQLNEVREAETTLTVEIVWRDLRTGEVLSQPRPKNGIFPPPIPMIDAPPGTMPPAPISAPTPPMELAGPVGAPMPPSPIEPVQGPAPTGAPPPPPPVLVQSIAGFIPELGETLATAEQRNVNRLAVQIVSMMEKPW
jgi:hypothetical protein